MITPTGPSALAWVLGLLEEVEEEDTLTEEQEEEEGGGGDQAPKTFSRKSDSRIILMDIPDFLLVLR